MAMFSKAAVPLSAIRPSGANPRKDFGDIGALADAIRATGGEPVNPPVVVIDGNVYRIIDGERRYRALKEVWAGEPDREVGVLLATDLDAANELVAMVATDDKLCLTDEELARGVQQMLLLGVDEERAARASRATAGQVRAAKRLSGSVAEGWQVTLDQLEAASRLESEEDREAVLSAGEGWRCREQAIRERVAAERRTADKVAWLEDAGIPVQMGGAPPEGMGRVAVVFANEPAGRLAREAKGLDGACLAVLERGDVRLFAPEGHPVLASASDPLDEEIARERAAALGLARRMTSFVAAGLARRCDEVDRLAVASRRQQTMAWRLMDEEGRALDGAISDWAGSLPCSEYETGAWLMRRAAQIACGYRSRYSTPASDRSEAAELLEVVDLFACVGFDGMVEEDEWLLGNARDLVDSTGAAE